MFCLARSLMDRYLETLWGYLAHNEQVTLQIRLFRLICLTGAVLCLAVVLPVNLVQNLPVLVNVCDVLLGLFALYCYWQSRRGRHLIVPFLTVAVILLDPVWFLNAGADGSITLYFFPLLLYPMVLCRGKMRWIITVCVVLNVVGLLFLDYFFPVLTVPFQNASDRLVDLVSGVVCSSLAMVMIVWVIITNYDWEREQLVTLHQKLLETSRLSGMAEVATSVLHNVGNVLNSVNVSATLVCDGLRQSRISHLKKAARMIQDHRADLAAYLATDERGQHLPLYLVTLADHLAQEQEALIAEAELLIKNVGHIKDIVSMQQSYARVSGVLERLPIVSVVEDALQMNWGGLQRRKIKIVREYEDLPPANLEKHKVLQILLNLVRNAEHALEEHKGTADKCLRIGIKPAGSDRFQISVRDNGIGIHPQNLTRIFSHGFTTKKDGHGFGLHMGALAAKEMGGSLTASSEGPGQGAVFILELPLDHSSLSAP